MSGAGGRGLVGRQGELDAVRAALTELGSGAGRALAFVGEPGIGKSALAAAAVSLARAAGVDVVAARGAPVPVPGPRRPVLVVVDDLHEVADAHIDRVERLVAATGAGPVLCLLAYRERQMSRALAAVLAGTVPAGLLERRTIGPLSAEQCRELLGDRPGVEAAHRASQGNPGYLAVFAGQPDAGTPILGELARLDRAALTLVRAAAVLEQPFRPELLAEVAELPVPATLTALDTLMRLDLVRPAEPAPHLALRHPAIGVVVYGRLEPSHRAELHRRADAVLADRAAPIALRAHHVARAADLSRPDDVITLIAAARGMLYGSPAGAAGYLQTVLPLLRDGDPHRHEVQVLLARARLLTGEASEGRALLDALRSAPPRRAPDEAHALVDSSRIERQRGRYGEAAALARAGLAALADRDTGTAAALHTELADHAYNLGDYETSQQHAETAAAIARRHHDPVGEAHALAHAALAQLFTGRQACALRTATRAADLVDAAPDAVLLTNLEAVFQLGMMEGMLGRLANSARHLERGVDLCRRTGQNYIEPAMLTALTNARLRSGSLPQALATLDEPPHPVEWDANAATEAITAMLRAKILFWRHRPGDLAEAVAQADHAVRLAGDTPESWAVTIRCFHAEFVLLTGDPARARWLMLDAAGGADLPKLTAWRRPRWCDTLAEAAAAEHDEAAVRHWAELAEVCLRQLPSTDRQGFARRARMRAHALAGEVDRALAAGRDAITDFSAGGERIEVGRTLLTTAAVALDAGDTGEVAQWLDRAAVLADRCGSARLAEEAATLRGRFTEGGALAHLTSREREVARLASTGMTSGGIAEALFLSVRTVDGHLGRVYRKLQVRNRASLIGALRAGVTPRPRSTPPAT
ncbi:HTH-type transcriptional regulator malT [Actinoplanes sp. SE50]|uniref:helix-turn-helix domain-containing protein n=1 Tax=unclassified Actinoplanes TaxID=2626549 RepID=UPI00023ECB5A|nr:MULTISPECIES: helix-turn-helix transcriptional regulator [unclassified Actinoplanes]AEV85428.1 HTH-type transcriptional regulator malT [Actinoplanes sp. SE50/110]ATO83823.1 HTH-type transcriptional regulator malT [Actinoplanes sp. SE50]SLM01231.1 LuxR-family transcriptional regulator [Actinoplanes sp. SE50/110]